MKSGTPEFLPVALCSEAQTTRAATPMGSGWSFETDQNKPCHSLAMRGF
jgi:hypothetical protein